MARPQKRKRQQEDDRPPEETHIEEDETERRIITLGLGAERIRSEKHERTNLRSLLGRRRCRGTEGDEEASLCRTLLLLPLPRDRNRVAQSTTLELPSQILARVGRDLARAACVART